MDSRGVANPIALKVPSYFVSLAFPTYLGQSIPNPAGRITVSIALGTWELRALWLIYISAIRPF